MKQVAVLATLCVVALVSWKDEDPTRVGRGYDLAVRGVGGDSKPPALTEPKSESDPAPESASKLRRSKSTRRYATDEIRQLVYHIRHGSNDRKWASALRLAELGPDAISALADIEAWLQDSEDRFGRARLALQYALIAMGTSAHVVVERLLGSRDAKAAKSACAVIQAWGPDAISFAPTLLKLAENDRNYGSVLAALGPSIDEMFLARFHERDLGWAKSYAEARGKRLLCRLGEFLTSADAKIQTRTLELLKDDSNAVVLQREIGILLDRTDVAALSGEIRAVAAWADKLPGHLAPRFAREVKACGMRGDPGRARYLAELLAKMGERGERALFDLMETELMGAAATVLVQSPQMKDRVANELEKRIRTVCENGGTPIQELMAVGHAELAMPSIVPVLEKAIRRGSPEQWTQLRHAIRVNDVDMDSLVKSVPGLADHVARQSHDQFDALNVVDMEFVAHSGGIDVWTEPRTSGVRSESLGVIFFPVVESQDELPIAELTRRLRKAEASAGHDRAKRRLFVLAHVEKLGPSAYSMLSLVRALLRSSQSQVRARAHVAMFWITGDEGHALAMLRDLDPFVRESAFLLLGTMGPRAVPILVRELPSPNALDALAGLGRAATKAIPAIKSIADNRWADEWLRDRAREAIQEIRSPGSMLSGFSESRILATGD